MRELISSVNKKQNKNKQKRKQEKKRKPHPGEDWFIKNLLAIRGESYYHHQTLLSQMVDSALSSNPRPYSYLLTSFPWPHCGSDWVDLRNALWFESEINVTNLVWLKLLSLVIMLRCYLFWMSFPVQNQSFTVLPRFIFWGQHGCHSLGFSRGILIVVFWLAELSCTGEWQPGTCIERVSWETRI